MNQEQKVIRVKGGVLELAKQLDNVLQCSPSRPARQNRAIEEESVELLVTAQEERGERQWSSSQKRPRRSSETFGERPDGTMQLGDLDRERYVPVYSEED